MGSHSAACTSISSATTPMDARVRDRTVRSPYLALRFSWRFPQPLIQSRSYVFLRSDVEKRPIFFLFQHSLLQTTALFLPSIFFSSSHKLIKPNSQPLQQNPRRPRGRRAPRRRPGQLQDRRTGQRQGHNHRQAGAADRAEQRPGRTSFCFSLSDLLFPLHLPPTTPLSSVSGGLASRLVPSTRSPLGPSDFANV